MRVEFAIGILGGTWFLHDAFLPEGKEVDTDMELVDWLLAQEDFRDRADIAFVVVYWRPGA